MTLAGSIIACVALGTLLLVIGIFDEEAGSAERRGGTGGPECDVQLAPAYLAPAQCVAVNFTQHGVRSERAACSVLCAAAAAAGEPKGETYGGVYEATPANRGAAEAAGYSSPTRE